MITDRQMQTRRAFAPSDIETLLSVPDIEAKYRLLRNEWLTLHSRYKQAEERVIQAERKGHPWEIEDARADRARVSTELGVYRKMALLARMRAEAEVYREVSEKLLPPDVKAAIQNCVCDILGRDWSDMRRDSGQSAAKAEDYRDFDRLMARWTLRTEDA